MNDGGIAYINAYPFAFDAGEGRDRLRVSVFECAGEPRVLVRMQSAELDPQQEEFTCLGAALATVLEVAGKLAGAGHPSSWQLAYYTVSYQTQYAAASRLQHELVMVPDASREVH